MLSTEASNIHALMEQLHDITYDHALRAAGRENNLAELRRQLRQISDRNAELREANEALQQHLTELEADYQALAARTDIDSRAAFVKGIETAIAAVEQLLA